MGSRLLQRYVRIVESGTEKALGSGFRLSARRVLTARHVVGECQQVTVLDLESRKWTPSAATVTWTWIGESRDDGIDLDVALLETAPVKSIEPWTKFLNRLPVDGREEVCEIVGYPGGNLPPDRRETVTVSAHLYEDLKQYMQLTPHRGEATGLDGWKGLSGSPVLTKESKILVGILTSKAKDYANRKLHGLPIATLCGLPEFREELEVPDHRHRVQALLERSTELLEKNGFGRELAAHHPRWGELCRGEFDPKELINTICFETDLEEQSMALIKALEAAIGSGRTDVARDVYEFSQMSLPAAVLQRFDSAPPDSDLMELRIPALTKIMVEVFMAGIDGRGLLLRPSVKSTTKDHPQPALNMSMPEETSIDVEGIQRSKDIEQRLIRDLGVENLQGYPDLGTGRTFDFIVKLAARKVLPGEDAFLIEEDADEVTLETNQEKSQLRTEVTKIVNEQLAMQTELGRRCYVVVGQSDLEFVEELRRRLPNLGRVFRERTERGASGEQRTKNLVRKAFPYRSSVPGESS